MFSTLDELSLKPHLLENQTLRGYHGTCFERANSIKESGIWKPSRSDCRMGPGVYFYQDSSGRSGMEAAFTWSATEESGQNCPDPCVIVCTVTGMNVLDLTEPQNLTYLSGLRDRLVNAVIMLIRELRREYEIPSDLDQGLEASPRAFDEHFIGQRINLCNASWRSKVDLIRSKFRLNKTNTTYFGFVVAQHFESIKIETIKKF